MIYLSLAILFATMLSGVPTAFAFLAACLVFLTTDLYTPDFMLVSARLFGIQNKFFEAFVI